MNSTIGRSPAIAAPDADAGEAMLGNGRVDHALRPELLQQTLADLVGALILRDLLAHQEHAIVAAHLLGHRIPKRLAHGLLDHLRVVSDDRLGLPDTDLGGWCFAGRRRRGGGLGLGAGCRHRVVEGRVGLAVGEEEGDRRVDRHALGAFLDQDLAELAFVDGLDLHGRLVRFDLGDHVTGGDVVADLLQPFGEVALGHGRRERGHQNFSGHSGLS